MARGLRARAAAARRCSMGDPSDEQGSGPADVHIQEAAKCCVFDAYSGPCENDVDLLRRHTIYAAGRQAYQLFRSDTKKNR